jgi:hypothetical protein
LMMQNTLLHHTTTQHYLSTSITTSHFTSPLAEGVSIYNQRLSQPFITGKTTYPKLNNKQSRNPKTVTATRMAQISQIDVYMNVNQSIYCSASGETCLVQ